MLDLSRLYDSILNGDDQDAIRITKDALDAAVDPVALVNQWMVPAMDEAGKRFDAQEFYIPEIMLAARAMKAALEPLRPLLAAGGAQSAGRVVIGTVKGDLHDIGKNLVASMLEGAGFEIIDLGIDVASEKFIEAVKSKNPHILALSTLLTVTMPEMKKTIDSLAQAGVRERVKILVGGAPVTRDYADEIGADGYGENARAAVTAARSLMVK
jgi:5-methyltetrahydrofolate--homocysteine methyltransferase